MPQLRWDLSFATLLQIGAMLAALAFGYGKMDSRLTTIENSLAATRIDIAEVQSVAVRRDVQAETLRQIEGRLQRIENSLR